MQHQQHKRAQLAAAAAHYSSQQQRQALLRWQANAAAAQQERLAMQLAARHMQVQLLSRAMAAWAAACAEAAAERQQLADAAAPAMHVLARLKLRRVVAGWRQVLVQQQQELEAVSNCCWLGMRWLPWACWLMLPGMLSGGFLLGDGSDST